MPDPHSVRGRSWAPGDRYPLASRLGDVALYAPGALMVLAAIVRGRSDLLGLALAVLGAAAILVGMLMPTLQGMALAPTPDDTAPMPVSPPVTAAAGNGAGVAREAGPSPAGPTSRA